MEGIDGAFIARAAALFGAGFAIAFGTLGPALGQGMIAKKACEMIGKYPESDSKIRTILILSLSIVETSGIFALLIALLLIFIGK